MDDLVSVVVAIFNGEKYLRECITSIINQSYTNIEIILVDDGSSDDSRKICEQMKEIDQRIKTIFREKNGGVSECRFTGLSIATGEWVIFVDHDDTIPYDCIQTFLYTTKIEDGIEVVCGNVADHCERDYNKDNIAEIDDGINVIRRYFDDSKMIKTSHESKLYNRNLLLRINVLQYRKRCPIAFFDDILITPIILGEAQKVAILPGVYYIHREVKTSISRSNLLNSFMYDHMEAGDIMLQYFINKNCNRSYSVKLTRYYQDILRIFCLMDYDDISVEKRQNYTESIIKYYKKYRKDFIWYGSGSIPKKVLFLLFSISPRLWKHLIQNTYYKSYRKDHNL